MTQRVLAADVEPLRASREQIIENFRVHGEIDAAAMSALVTRIQAFLVTAVGEPRARALYELATVQRLAQLWGPALKTYSAAIELARELRLTDVAFDSYLGMAKCHAYGTKDHGAAAQAFQHAERSMGASPTRKQRFELVSYAAELHEGWGDLDPALLYALEAASLADGDADKYYAELDLGSVLQAYVVSCDYRPLVDAMSANDGGAPYGACRRAVSAARTHYERARLAAQRLRWTGLVAQTEGFLRRLEERRQLLESKARHEEAVREAGLFRAQRREDILVGTDFAGAAASFADPSVFVPLLAHVVRAAGVTSRSLYLQGIQAELEKKPDEALAFYQRSVTMLDKERQSMFELRGRGTVIESRIEHMRDLGLRLLARADFEGSFAAFESIRAQGMSTLFAAFAGRTWTRDQRKSLSRLTQLDSKESGLLRGLILTTIAGVPYSKTESMLRELAATRAERTKLAADPELEALLAELRKSKLPATTLKDLQKLARSTGSAVVLYWTTPVNLLVWTITADSVHVRTVFLPESELNSKVARLTESLQREDAPFDQTTARELFAYLIAPVRDFYTGSQLLIVPHGALTTLPFEALVNAETSKYLIQESTIAYAPNGLFAARALKAPKLKVPPLRVIYASKLEAETGEVASLVRALGHDVEAKPSEQLSADPLAALGHAPNLHLLLHGIFNHDDALLSHLVLPTAGVASRTITASELLSVDWSQTKLVSLSSCEGAKLQTRISNEVYGLAWSLLVSGVPRVLLSRWRVQKQSNAAWMAHFYRALAANPSSAARASAAAMRAMIESSDYARPYYWAAPQLFGA